MRMANKLMKRHAISPATRKMQVTMRQHNPPIRMAKIRTSDPTKCWQECGGTGLLIHPWWEYKIIQSLRKVLVKINMYLYDPAIELLDFYPPKMKTYIHTKTCTQMFITLFLVTAWNWKHTFPSTDEWLNCSTSPTWDTAQKWRKCRYLDRPQWNWLREDSQSQKATYYIIPFI